MALGELMSYSWVAPPVSVGQEAEVGAWLGEDRSVACTEGTGH